LLVLSLAATSPRRRQCGQHNRDWCRTGGFDAGCKGEKEQTRYGVQQQRCAEADSHPLLPVFFFLAVMSSLPL
jgi:hypothetical protein